MSWAAVGCVLIIGGVSVVLLTVRLGRRLGPGPGARGLVRAGSSWIFVWVGVVMTLFGLAMIAPRSGAHLARGTAVRIVAP